MTHYLDTSVVIALLTPEAHSDRIDTWFAAHPEAALAISPWVITEIASALSIKLRSGAIDADQRALVMARWQQMLSDSISVLPVTQPHFEAAANFAAQHALGLRAGDALHLAVAADAGCSLLTLDQVMAAAAPHVGIPVDPL